MDDMLGMPKPVQEILVKKGREPLERLGQTQQITHEGGQMGPPQATPSTLRPSPCKPCLPPMDGGPGNEDMEGMAETTGIAAAAMSAGASAAAVSGVMPVAVCSGREMASGEREMAADEHCMRAHLQAGCRTWSCGSSSALGAGSPTWTCFWIGETWTSTWTSGGPPCCPCLCRSADPFRYPDPGRCPCHPSLGHRAGLDLLHLQMHYGAIRSQRGDQSILRKRKKSISPPIPRLLPG